jgi:hypothetical protein
VSEKKTSRRDYFKALTGKTYDDAFKRKRRPYGQSLDLIWKRGKTNYDLRLLGTGEKEVWISEEERSANFHILGEPEQGKSKFLEYHIRKDIDMGNGLCLLDPSDNGDTCKKILAYCAQNAVKKVVYISPDTLPKYGKIACLKPLQGKAVKQSVEGVMEALNILFNSKSTDTPRIRKNLSALLRLLAKSDLTIKESEIFADFQDIRNLDFIKDDRDSRTLKTVFKSPFTWEQYFASTINRLDAFWQEPLSLMFGSNTGIDFTKMISEGWVILVNLYPTQNFTVENTQLLGVLIISQIIQAIDNLNSWGWKGVHYLYIDEAGRFATPQIDNVLSYKRKSGLRLMLAHHYFEQFEDKKVMHAIKQGARIKVMFNTSSYQDRLEMVKDLGYGGDIPHVLATYANQNIPKQYAIIKKNKETPVRVRIPDVPEVKISKEKLDSYIKELLNQDFYLSKGEIEKQINARSLRANSKSSQSRKTSHSKPDNAPIVSRGIQQRRKQKQSVSESSQKPPIPESTEPIKI